MCLWINTERERETQVIYYKTLLLQIFNTWWDREH